MGRRPASLELTPLRHFLAVLSSGSINRAAEQLEISQPSLSQSIKGLERCLGAELLLRTGGGVRPTPIGETFARYAQVITREADKACAEVAAMRGLGTGRILLAIHSALASYVAPAALVDFLGQSIGVQVEIAVSSFSSQEIINRLRRAEWDMVVTLAGLETQYPPEIVVERLRPVESRVYCGAQHPLAAKTLVSLEDLAGYEWIISNLGLAEQMLARVFEHATRVPTVRVRTDAMALIPELAAVHPFLCVLPVETAMREVTAGRLVEVRQRFIRSQSSLAIAYSGLVAHTAATRALVKSVVARTREAAPQ